jgi:hypothetical protein
MAKQLLRTELTYRVECTNLDEGGFQDISDLAVRLPGGRKQALGIAPRVEVKTLKCPSYAGELSFIMTMSAKSAIDLENGLLAYMRCAGAPYSIKGAYDIAEKVLELPEFNKTLLPNWLSFFSGKLVVDLPRTDVHDNYIS